jgi:transposase-like protein
MMPVDQNTLLSPLNDLVFKALFGREQKQSKIILMDFLNSVLNLEEKDKITEIAYLNPFNGFKSKNTKRRKNKYRNSGK